MVTIPDGFALIVHEFTYPNAAGAMVVTEGVELGAVPDEDAVTFIRNQFQLNVVTLLGAALEYPRTVVYVGEGAAGSIPVESTSEAAGGSRGGDGLTTNTAILVRKVTASAGRKNRGRLYLPGCTANMQGDANLLVAGFQVDLQGGINTYLANTNVIAAAIEGRVILHADGSTPTPVTGYQVQTRLTTQRGRLRD